MKYYENDKKAKGDKINHLCSDDFKLENVLTIPTSNEWKMVTNLFLESG